MNSQHARWEAGQTIALDGITIELSRPRLVARSRDYLWFPTMAMRGGGEIAALAQEHPDVSNWPVPQWLFLSHDQGLSWPDRVKLPSSCETFLRTASGDLLLLPYALLKEGPDWTGRGFVLLRGGTNAQPLDRPIRVTGWPVETHCIPKPADTKHEEEKRQGVVMTGQTVRAADGKHLVALYYTATLKPRRYGVVVAESADGLDWRVLSTIAVPETEDYTGNEGANEATLGRAGDGRLFCVYRAGGWHPYHAFGIAWSGDDGKTWTPGSPISAGDSFLAPMAVQPSVVTMPDGTILLAGGRPGMRFWVDPTGKAAQWQHVDLQLHHTWCVPQEPILGTDHHARKQSSSYVELMPVDDRNVLLIYDRTPNGWDKIPDDMNETNSIWIVRLTLNRTAEKSNG